MIGRAGKERYIDKDSRIGMLEKVCQIYYC
jgi:hypothetical protein